MLMGWTSAWPPGASQELCRSLVHPGELCCPCDFPSFLGDFRSSAGLLGKWGSRKPLPGFSWWLSKLCLLSLKIYHQQFFSQGNWVLSCYRWDCHSSENCCQPVHLFLCEVVAWWGQMAGLGLKDYLLLLAPSPCPGNHVKWSSGFKSLQSLGFSSLSLRETEMIVFLRSLFCAHFPPSSASLWNSDAGMRLPSSS